MTPGTNASEGLQGAFTGSMGDLVTYRYVGCRSELLDRDHAEGSTAMRRHLRTPSTISGTALAVSMLDTAGINVDPAFLLALTQIDLQLYEPALDISASPHCRPGLSGGRADSGVHRMSIQDAERPGRVIGSGAANWSVLSPTPEGFVYTDPGVGSPDGPDTPSMVEIFELEAAPDGNVVVPQLSPRIGAELLHHGPVLAAIEQSALRAMTRTATGTPALLSWTMRMVRAGRTAPFTASAEVLAVTPELIACRAEMRDGNDETIAVAHLSYQR